MKISRYILLIAIFLTLFPPLLCADQVEKVAPVVQQGVDVEVMTFSNIMQMIFGLVVVILMIFGSAWLIKRLGKWQGAYTGDLKVLGGISLGARERAVLVQVGEKQLLVGVAPGCVRTLCELDEPIKTTQVQSSNLAEKFSEVLNKQKNERSDNEAV